MSPIPTSVLAILALALSVWFMRVAGAPKRWRGWWLHVWSLSDSGTPSVVKRKEEAHIRLVGLVLAILLAGTSVSCATWAYTGLMRQKSATK